MDTSRVEGGREGGLAGLGEAEALAALARMTKSKASAKRSFEQRADDLFLAGVMESTTTALLDAADDMPTGEVVFPRAQLDVDSVEIKTELGPDELTLPETRELSPVVASLEVRDESDTAEVRRHRRRTSNGSLITAASVAVAAVSMAAAVFFFARSHAAEPATTNPVAVAATAVAIEPASPPATPALPMVVDSPPELEAVPAAEEVQAPAPEASAPSEPTPTPSSSDVSSKRERAAAQEEVLAAAEAELAAEAERAAAEAEILAKAEAELAAKAAAEAELAAKAVPVSAPANQSIAELLDQGAGDLEVASPSEEPKKPSKKEITRDELKGQIAKIRGRVIGCATQSGDTGTAELRFTVQPNGRVSNGALAGTLGGTALESCVRPVIESMRFEAFDGAPTSFTYPVLLKW